MTTAMTHQMQNMLRRLVARCGPGGNASKWPLSQTLLQKQERTVDKSDGDNQNSSRQQ